MKGQDVVILLKLVSLADQSVQRHSDRPAGARAIGDDYSVRGLETSLGISKTEVSASIKRSIAAGLAYKDRRTNPPAVHRRQLCEFIIHGLKYVFPAHVGTITRGLPTSIFMASFAGKIASANDAILVWPSAEATHRGLALTPLFKTAPHAASLDNRLYEYLALVDAIRVGRTRDVGFARDQLSARLLP